MTFVKAHIEQNRHAVPEAVAKHGEDDERVSAAFLTWSTAILFAYFAARLVYFALNLSSFVPPDEVTHAGICRVFSQVLLFPENAPATYEYGLVTNIPWLYYGIMGKLLHLNFFGVSDLVFLRLLNIPLALGTVVFARRTLLLLANDRLAQLLLVVAMTNIAMFSLMSASVSYDNLTNFLAAMAVFYLMAYFRHRSGNLLAAALLAQLLGCLTKITFLPLTLVLTLLLIGHEARNVRCFPTALKCWLLASGRRTWLLMLLIVIALVLNLNLYAGNFLRYGVINPSMPMVLSAGIAMNYRLEARGLIFDRYKRGEISYMDALMLAGEIKHPGDKADTFGLLMNYENLKRNPGLWLGPLAYAKVWFINMVATTFGIKAHLIMVKDLHYLIPLYVVMVLALLGFIIRWRPRSGWLPPCLIAIVCFYAGYLMVEINYSSYQQYGAPGITLYGRYLFPLLVPLSVLVCHYLLRLFRARSIRIVLALATALLLIAYDFPWFLAHATPEWYTWLPEL